MCFMFWKVPNGWSGTGVSDHSEDILSAALRWEHIGRTPAQMQGVLGVQLSILENAEHRLSKGRLTHLPLLFVQPRPGRALAHGWQDADEGGDGFYRALVSARAA